MGARARERRYHGPVHFAPVLAVAVALWPLSASFPPDTTSAAVVAGWERMAGEGRADGVEIRYELFVAPGRPALYAVTRFRLKMKDEPEARSEFLIWNSRPGEAIPLLCFERVPNADAPGTWRWASVPHGTDAYRTAMVTAVRVYALHQARLVAAAEAAGRR